MNKSIEEMSQSEKKRHSLAAKTFNLVLAGASVMGVILLLLGLALYSFAVANQYISTAYTLSRSAAEVLHESSEVEKLSVEVIGRYRALSAEERAEVDTDEYEERFDDIPEGGI